MWGGGGRCGAAIRGTPGRDRPGTEGVRCRGNRWGASDAEALKSSALPCPMKNKIIEAGLKLFAPKLVRQGLAAIGGFFAGQGMAVDDTSMMSIVGGFIAYVIAAAYSYFAKAAPDDEKKDLISKIAGALASQAIAFVAGWLQSIGYAGGIDDSVGVSLFALNYGLSKVSRPDKPKEAITGRGVSERPGGVVGHEMGSKMGKS